MARNRTQIEGTDFVKIAQNLGLDIVVNRGWTKCYRPGSRKVGVGVPNTKLVTRIELVGFTHALGATHPKPPAKTVEQELAWSEDRRTTLQNFYQVCAEGLLGAVLKPQAVASSGAGQDLLSGRIIATSPSKTKQELIAEFEAEFNGEPEPLVGCA